MAEALIGGSLSTCTLGDTRKRRPPALGCGRHEYLTFPHFPKLTPRIDGTEVRKHLRVYALLDIFLLNGLKSLALRSFKSQLIELITKHSSTTSERCMK